MSIGQHIYADYLHAIRNGKLDVNLFTINVHQKIQEMRPTDSSEICMQMASRLVNIFCELVGDLHSTMTFEYNRMRP